MLIKSNFMSKGFNPKTAAKIHNKNDLVKKIIPQLPSPIRP